MEISHKHTLGQAEAQRRIEKLTTLWKKEHGVDVSWNGNQAHLVGKVMGIDIDANVTVGENSIDAVGKDPGFLKKKLAESYLKNKLADVMNPNASSDTITA